MYVCLIPYGLVYHTFARNHPSPYDRLFCFMLSVRQEAKIGADAVCKKAYFILRLSATEVTKMPAVPVLQQAGCAASLLMVSLILFWCTCVSHMPVDMSS